MAGSAKECRQRLAAILTPVLVVPTLAAALQNHRSLATEFKSPLVIVTTNSYTSDNQSPDFAFVQYQMLVITLCRFGEGVSAEAAEDSLDDIGNATITELVKPENQETPDWIGLDFQSLKNDTISYGGGDHRRSMVLITVGANC